MAYSSSPAAGEDLRLAQARAVEHAAGRPGQLGQVPGVEPHPDRAGQPQPGGPRRWRPAPPLGVVGVDQEGGLAGEILGERGERRFLVAECLDERVRHRARRGQAVAAGRLDVAGGGEAGDRRGAGHGQPGVDSLGAAEREVHQLRPARGQHAPGRLGRDAGLEGDVVQQYGLGQLRFGDRRGHLEQRLGGEHGACPRAPPAPRR